MTGKVALSVSVFSEPCRIVESVMNSVMYPNFLGSETYLNFVQKMQGDVWYVSRSVCFRNLRDIVWRMVVS